MAYSNGLVGLVTASSFTGTHLGAFPVYTDLTRDLVSLAAISVGKDPNTIDLVRSWAIRLWNPTYRQRYPFTGVLSVVALYLS